MVLVPLAHWALTSMETALRNVLGANGTRTAASLVLVRAPIAPRSRPPRTDRARLPIVCATQALRDQMVVHVLHARVALPRRWSEILPVQNALPGNMQTMSLPQPDAWPAKSTAIRKFKATSARIAFVMQVLRVQTKTVPACLALQAPQNL